MNDFQRLTQTLQNRDETCALATVVQTEGSTYRHTGARMLMFRDGTMIGAISGGCLENDVFERALAVIDTGIPQFVVYDGREDAQRPNGVVTGLGMGCNGVTSVLVERIEGANDPFIAALRDALAKQERICVATAFDVSPNGILTGLHAILHANGDILDNFGETVFAERLRERLTNAAPAVLLSGKPHHILLQAEGCSVQCVLEAVPLPKEIIIFGAGYDAVPLPEYASLLGWRTSVLDVRPMMLTQERFPKAHRIQRFHTETIQETVAELGITADTAVVVMTHHLERDAEIVRCVLPYKPCYVGLLGPKERFAKIQNLWNERNYLPNQKLLAPLHTPIGLDIGTETAEEVALSIIAEIQAVFNSRKGGFLKQRKRRIHEG